LNYYRDNLKFKCEAQQVR